MPEELITGKASWHDKFLAFAGTMNAMPGNPLYAWAHMELKQYFGVAEPLSSATAEKIWRQTCAVAESGAISARRLIEGSKVEVIYTTNDPAEDLSAHQSLAKDRSFRTKVRPTFRPDIACMGIARPDFSSYVEKLGRAAGNEIRTFADWLAALEKRLDFFYENGCRIADLSVGAIPDTGLSETLARQAFEKAAAGGRPDPAQEDAYTFYMLVFFAKLYAAKGIAMQLHLSALRNCNTALYGRLGADCGVDSVGPAVSVRAFGRLLDTVERSGGLPRTLVYTLNPSSYYELATMIGNFQGGTGTAAPVPGKMQLGAAWWFNDHLDGIREQLRISAAVGLLGRFPGMLTDSRSFSSYPRHDYFRRILCSVIGEWVERGEFTDDRKVLENLDRGICVQNARDYFGE